MVEIDETRLLTVSLVLMLVPLGLITYGVLEGIDSLWWIGIVLLIVGGLIPPVARYLLEDDEGDTETENEAGGD